MNTQRKKSELQEEKECKDLNSYDPHQELTSDTSPELDNIFSSLSSFSDDLDLSITQRKGVGAYT